jgi:hypothetical protein
MFYLWLTSLITFFTNFSLSSLCSSSLDISHSVPIVFLITYSLNCFPKKQQPSSVTTSLFYSCSHHPLHFASPMLKSGISKTFRKNDLVSVTESSLIKKSRDETSTLRLDSIWSTPLDYTRRCFFIFQCVTSYVEPSNDSSFLNIPLMWPWVTLSCDHVISGATKGGLREICFSPCNSLQSSTYAFSKTVVSIAARLQHFKVCAPSIPAMWWDLRYHDLDGAPELTDQI